MANDFLIELNNYVAHWLNRFAFHLAHTPINDIREAGLRHYRKFISSDETSAEMQKRHKLCSLLYSAQQHYGQDFFDCRATGIQVDIVIPGVLDSLFKSELADAGFRFMERPKFERDADFWEKLKRGEKI